jgi:hypothetical protein
MVDFATTGAARTGEGTSGENEGETAKAAKGVRARRNEMRRWRTLIANIVMIVEVFGVDCCCESQEGGGDGSLGGGDFVKRQVFIDFGQ